MKGKDLFAWIYLMAGAVALCLLALLVLLIVNGTTHLSLIPALFVSAVVVMASAKIIAVRLGKAEYHG